MPHVNECFTATVRDLSSDGNGIVEHNSGQVFFVPGVWTGEVAEFQITGFRKRFGFARLVKLVEPSPHRITAPCPHHGFDKKDCGGCPWQFMGYDAQLAAKETRVRNYLARLGVVDAIRPIAGSPRQFGYRNRAQFKSDGRAIGYVGQGSSELAAIGDCPILTDHNRETLRQLLATLPNPAFRPERKSPWSTLDIDEGLGAETVSINRRRPFQQANSEQNGRMRDWLAEGIAGLDRRATVLELFAGSGNFTEVLAEAGFDAIHAVEGVGEALEALQGKSLAGVTTAMADLFSETGVARVAREMARTEILVLDPPRDGFPALETLLKTCRKLRHVFYISCDLATFSRDVKVLLDQGFRVEEVQPLDLFPHTPHVELLARLKK